jgi:hypothetical protein
MAMSAAAFWEADVVTPFSGSGRGDGIFFPSPLAALLGWLREIQKAGGAVPGEI